MNKETVELAISKIGQDFGQLLTIIKDSGTTLSHADINKGFGWLTGLLHATEAQARTIRDSADAEKTFSFDMELPKKKVILTGFQTRSGEMSFVKPKVAEKAPEKSASPIEGAGEVKRVGLKKLSGPIAIGRLVGTKEILFGVPDKAAPVDLKDAESGVDFLDK